MSPTQHTMIWGSAPSTTCLKLWEYVSETEKQSVLILGVGDGRNAKFLITQNFSVVAVDPDKDAIEELNEWAKVENLPVVTYVSDYDSIELSGQFDIILCVGSLKNSSKETIDSTFAKIKAATKPNGYNAISVFVEKPFIEPASSEGLFKTGDLMSQYGDCMIMWTGQELYRGDGSDLYCVDRVIARVPPKDYRVNPDDVTMLINLA